MMWKDEWDTDQFMEFVKRQIFADQARLLRFVCKADVRHAEILRNKSLQAWALEHCEGLKEITNYTFEEADNNGNPD